MNSMTIRSLKKTGVNAGARYLLYDRMSLIHFVSLLMKRVQVQ